MSWMSGLSPSGMKISVFFRCHSFPRANVRQLASVRMATALMMMGIILASSSTLLHSPLTPGIAAAASPVPCNCVIFRFDDVQDFYVTPVQLAVLDQFINQDASVSLGVIMNFVGNDP